MIRFTLLQKLHQVRMEWAWDRKIQMENIKAVS